MSEERILRFDFKEAAEAMREDDPQQCVADGIISFAEDAGNKINSMIDTNLRTVSINGVNIVASNITIGFDTSLAYCVEMIELGLNVYSNIDSHATYLFDAESSVVTVKKDSRYPSLLTINVDKADTK